MKIDTITWPKATKLSCSPTCCGEVEGEVRPWDRLYTKLTNTSSYGGSDSNTQIPYQENLSSFVFHFYFLYSNSNFSQNKNPYELNSSSPRKWPNSFQIETPIFNRVLVYQVVRARKGQQSWKSNLETPWWPSIRVFQYFCGVRKAFLVLWAELFQGSSAGRIGRTWQNHVLPGWQMAESMKTNWQYGRKRSPYRNISGGWTSHFAYKFTIR